MACARAGLYTGVQVNAEGMFGCDFVRENFTCEFIGIQDAASIPDDCSVWGPFGRAARGGPRVRGDVADAWLMLTSASLAGPLGGGWCAAVSP